MFKYFLLGNNINTKKYLGLLIIVNILAGSYVYYEIVSLQTQNTLLNSKNDQLQNQNFLLEKQLNNINTESKIIYITTNKAQNKNKPTIDSQNIEELIAQTSQKHNIPKFLIPNNIEDLPNEKLEKYLSNFIKYKADDLPRNMELKKYINTMAKIALSPNVQKDDSIEKDPNPRDLRLIYPIADENGKIDKKFFDNESNNTKKSQKLIVTLDLTGYDDDRVLLKWINLNTGNIIRYQYYDVKPNAFNHITFSDIDSLQNGNYIIEIYTTKDNVKLIGTFDFYVE